jgi:MerR, DNA binding
MRASRRTSSPSASHVNDPLAIRDTGSCPCEAAGQLLRRRLAELDAEMVRLTALHDQMVNMIEALPTKNRPPPTPGTWGPRGEVRMMLEAILSLVV